MYSLDKTKSKIQLSVFLEENNQTFFSYNKFLNQTYAENGIDYTNRYLYTFGDKIGILLDKDTNKPIQEIYNTGSLDLTTNTGTYIVQFTNTKTNSGTIEGSGQSLLTNISVIQSACILGNTAIQNQQQIIAYDTNTVAYNETCNSITRKCINSVLDGDTNYKYDTCSSLSALNCNSTTYSGYIIPIINHDSNQNVTKIITGGVADITASCVNGELSYGTENINCDINYVLDNGECKQDICTGTAPDWSVLNGTQKYNTDWLHNITPGDCTFICQAGYYWNNTICASSSAGYYVATEGQTTQTACGGNDKYQNLTGQTSCNTVSNGYYTTGGTSITRTGQTECEANNWCSGGVKTACATGYSSPAGSTSSASCIINSYTVSGTVTNGNGATVNICGKTITADTSGIFSLEADYGTVCNNAVITKTNYTCITTTQGPNPLTTNFTTVAGNCVANTQTITTCGGSIPTGGISNATTITRTQTWNGTIWTPTNNRIYNATAGICTYRCNAGYYWDGISSCIPASAGYYVASAGATSQTACSIGYGSLAGASSCTPQWSGDSTTGYLFKNTSLVDVYPISCNNLLTVTTWKNTYVGSPWNGTKFNDGFYWIKPDTGTAFKVYCDMTNNGGGRTRTHILRYVNLSDAYATSQNYTGLRINTADKIWNTSYDGGDSTYIRPLKRINDYTTWVWLTDSNYTNVSAVSTIATYKSNGRKSDMQNFIDYWYNGSTIMGERPDYIVNAGAISGGTANTITKGSCTSLYSMVRGWRGSNNISLEILLSSTDGVNCIWNQPSSIPFQFSVPSSGFPGMSISGMPVNSSYVDQTMWHSLWVK